MCEWVCWDYICSAWNLKLNTNPEWQEVVQFVPINSSSKHDWFKIYRKTHAPQVSTTLNSTCRANLLHAELYLREVVEWSEFNHYKPYSWVSLGQIAEASLHTVQFGWRPIRWRPHVSHIWLSVFIHVSKLCRPFEVMLRHDSIKRLAVENMKEIIVIILLIHSVKL